MSEAVVGHQRLVILLVGVVEFSQSARPPHEEQVRIVEARIPNGDGFKVRKTLKLLEAIRTGLAALQVVDVQTRDGVKQVEPEP